MKSRIIVAEDEPITRLDICDMLKSANYNVVGEASDGLQAVDLCRKHKPNLILMDIKMPKLDGIQAGQMIMEENLVDALIILTAYSSNEFIDKVKKIGAIGYIVKPIDETKLIPQIEIALEKAKEFTNMKEKIISVEQELEDTKTIHCAKELLMEKYSLSENDAYKKLRKLSMDNQCSILQTSRDLVSYYSKPKNVKNRG